MLRRTLWWINAALHLLFITAISSEQICKSIEVHRMQDFEKLRNCSIVVGHIRIENVQVEATTSLESMIEEITDYLVVQRTQGLESLQQIFPHLMLIRGKELFFKQYALVVYENRDLLDLGFSTLQRIQTGAIRIEQNPALCFTKTINWVYLLGNSTSQHYSLKHNKSPNHCPLCTGDPDLEIVAASPINRHCWNLNTYQRFLNYGSCYATCGALGCDEQQNCCSRKCLTSCNTKNCKKCALLSQNRKCVDYCGVAYYQYNKRLCILEAECHSYGLIPHEGVCIEKCPDNYQQISDKSGQLTCALICTGNYVVHTTKDIYKLKDCVTITGSLTIELTEIKTKIVTELERVLMSVREITDYLKIVHSPQLVSLQFLRNLDTIRGSSLINNRYALYVVDNHHLEEIWATNQRVAITNGYVYFHLNPRLCYDKIMKLESTLKNAQGISISDVSLNSNGERVVCGASVRVLNASVEDFNSTAVRIKVDPMTADDNEVLIGYMHHYKEASAANITMYDGRHGCGHDNWLMDISPNKNVRHVITNLKPYTRYAYFVKTMTMTDYHMQIDAYSEIKYFTTLPSKPGRITKIFYHPLSTTEIELYWWPPRQRNGIIKQFILNYAKIQDPIDVYLETKTPFSNSTETCECLFKDPDASGPAPEDENYYNKEQITYDNALANLIYVSRSFPSNFNAFDTNEDGAQNKEIIDNISNTSDSNEIIQLLSKEHQTNMNSANIETDSQKKIHQKIRRKAPDNESKSPNNINKLEKEYHKNLTLQEKEMEARLTYDKIRQEIESKALAEQDTGTTDFAILKPTKICWKPNASVQFQLENSCTNLESFSGITLPGHVHSYILSNLEPEVTYRISIRACVEGLENGCGGETIIYGETVSKRIETFLKGLREFY